MPPVRCCHCGADNDRRGRGVAVRHCVECGRPIPVAGVGQAVDGALRVLGRYALRSQPASILRKGKRLRS